MADFVFECPLCKAEIEADETMSGSTAQCPNCNGAILVPQLGIDKGMEIAGFKLVRRLGTGGMGEVWLAEQLSIARKVAIKILSPALVNNTEFVARFMREGKLAGKLEHPNIVTAFDAGVQNNLYYLAVSFIDGITLGDRVKIDKKIPEKEALHIVKCIAEALKYAWDDFKLLHRDIKPANIMIDKKGVPKLMDMGISKSADEKHDLTMTGVIMGTPYYISPEQAMAKPDIDCRSDIYSLGATFYHVVTGQVPYDADTALSIITKHIMEELPPPELLNPELSRPCAALIKRMMEKKPEERIQSWESVIKNVDLVMQGKMPEDNASFTIPVPASPNKEEEFSKTQSLNTSVTKLQQKIEDSNRINVKHKSDTPITTASLKKPQIVDHEFIKKQTGVGIAPVQKENPKKFFPSVDPDAETQDDDKMPPPEASLPKIPETKMEQTAKLSIKTYTQPSVKHITHVLEEPVHKRRFKTANIKYAVLIILAIVIIVPLVIFLKKQLDSIQEQTRASEVRTALIKLQNQVKAAQNSGDLNGAITILDKYRGPFLKETENEREAMLAKLKNIKQGIAEVADKDELRTPEEVKAAFIAVNPGLTDIRVSVENGAVTSLSIQSPKLVDISPLTKIKTLKNLNLADCKNIADITPIMTCKSLERLIIYPYHKDIFKLIQCNNIKFISDENIQFSQMKKNAETFWRDLEKKTTNNE